jgi:hypothetical protein
MQSAEKRTKVVWKPQEGNSRQTWMYKAGWHENETEKNRFEGVERIRVASDRDRWRVPVNTLPKLRLK